MKTNQINEKETKEINKKETKQSKNKKKSSYKLSKDFKYKMAKGISKGILGGAIVLTLAGIGIIKYSSNGKTSEEAKIQSTTFEDNLDKVADNTCLDELLNENILNNISIIERQLQASNDIQDLNLEKYDIIKSSESYDNVSIDVIEYDISRIKQLLAQVDKGQIDLNVPTKETTEFYRLANKIYNVDSKACNSYLSNCQKDLIDMYRNVISAKFLDYCKLDESYVNNITFSKGEVEVSNDVKYVNPDSNTEDNYIQYKAKEKNTPYQYQISTDILGKAYKNLESMADNIKGLGSGYDKKRNKIIEDSLTNLKELLYYEMHTEEKFFSDVQILTGDFDSSMYQDSNPKKLTKK